MVSRPLLALYSLAHLWVDLSCALLLFGPLSGTPPLYLLLYNFCAFALQMPLGLAADRLSRCGPLAAAGCCLTALAYLSPLPLPAVLAAGVGNALFHLGGGTDVLRASGERGAALGIFVSPGALGLYLGTLWALGGSALLWTAPAGLLALAWAIWLLRRRAAPRSKGRSAPPSGGSWAVLPLLLVVVLRSYMGMNQSFAWKSQGAWALYLTLALALGKTAGGFAMDRLGPRRASAVSLALAGGLYLASALPLAGTLAVFLFNMTMPVTLWAVARALPGAEGFSFGILTFGLFLGFLPSYLGWPSLLSGPAACAAASLLSLALLYFPLGSLARPAAGAGGGEGVGDA